MPIVPPSKVLGKAYKNERAEHYLDPERVEAFRRSARRRRRGPGNPAGRVFLAAGTFGLRQDDLAAYTGGPGVA